MVLEMVSVGVSALPLKKTRRVPAQSTHVAHGHISSAKLETMLAGTNNKLLGLDPIARAGISLSPLKSVGIEARRDAMANRFWSSLFETFEQILNTSRADRPGVRGRRG